MKSRLDNLIDDLDKCIQEDIEVSSQIFGLGAESIQKHEELLQILDNNKITVSCPTSNNLVLETHPLTEESLRKKYKKYQKAYDFYHQNYGITCKRGWKNLLAAIKHLSSPQKTNGLEERVTHLEQKVTQLEKTIDILVKIIKQ